MPLLKSLALSLIASALATYLLRRAVSAEGGHPGRPGQHVNPVIVIVPVLVGNSGNRVIEIRTQTAPLSFLGFGKRK